MVQHVLNAFYSQTSSGAYEVLMRDHEIPGWRRHLFKQLEEHGVGSVLELGVGTGLNIPLYPYGPRYVGVDVNQHMLWQAERKREINRRTDLQLLRADARALPFPENSFDAAVLTYALSGMPDQEQVLAEASRVVKEGGVIGIIDFCKVRGPRSLLALGGCSPMVLDELVASAALPVRHRAVAQSPKSSITLTQQLYVLENKRAYNEEKAAAKPLYFF